MAQPTLILLTMFLLFSPAIDRGTASADENPPFDNAKPPEPKIKEIRVEKVRALTGSDSPTEMKPLDVCGTDLPRLTREGDDEEGERRLEGIRNA